MTNKEKEELFDRFLLSMGGGVREVELSEANLEAGLRNAIEDYTEILQNFLIESQWTSVYGADMSTTDLSFALSVRGLDYADKFTYAYSKQVGLQQRGNWELKKDFINIERGVQVYEIPANREINEVLYFTPPTTKMAMFANYAGAGMGMGFGGVMPTMGGGGIGLDGFFIAPAYDVMLTAQDLKQKQRLLGSELSYKVTAGANGTKLLHLLNLPDSRFSFDGDGLMDGGMGVLGGALLGVVGCQVWYHYYDTTGYDKDDCRRDNPDIILLPNEVPLSKMEYSSFNEPTKVIIRQLFFAESKKILALIRGKFSGVVGAPDVQLKMDYEMLITQAKEEREETITKLRERLDRMMPEKMMERMANEAEYLNRQLKYRPLGFYLK